MRLDQLKGNVGERLRLRPIPRANALGNEVEVDDLWRLTRCDDVSVDLTNERTGQVRSLAHDHIHHFVSPPPGAAFGGFLELNVTIHIASDEVRVEPIPSGASRGLPKPVAPLRSRVQLLLDHINPEIRQRAVAGNKQIGVTISVVNVQLLGMLQQEPEFNDLMSVTATGSGTFGVGCRIGDNVHDRNDVGQALAFVLDCRRLFQ